MKIKTIDIIFKEWFDSNFGNSYHAGTVTVNFGLKTEITFICPMEYGYGDQYIHTAMLRLINEKLIKMKRHDDGSYPSFKRYCQDRNIILNTSLQEKCSKRALNKY